MNSSVTASRIAPRVTVTGSPAIVDDRRHTKFRVSASLRYPRIRKTLAGRLVHRFLVPHILPEAPAVALLSC